jgi:hypothetical protein
VWARRGPRSRAGLIAYPNLPKKALLIGLRRETDAQIVQPAGPIIEVPPAILFRGKPASGNGTARQTSGGRPSAEDLAQVERELAQRPNDPETLNDAVLSRGPPAISNAVVLYFHRLTRRARTIRLSATTTHAASITKAGSTKLRSWPRKQRVGKRRLTKRGYCWPPRRWRSRTMQQPISIFSKSSTRSVRSLLRFRARFSCSREEQRRRSRLARSEYGGVYRYQIGADRSVNHLATIKEANDDSWTEDNIPSHEEIALGALVQGARGASTKRRNASQLWPGNRTEPRGGKDHRRGARCSGLLGAAG